MGFYFQTYSKVGVTLNGNAVKMNYDTSGGARVFVTTLNGQKY